VADDQKILAELKKCMKDAKGDPGRMASCQTTFVQAGGTVTPDGGKVFATPNGSAAFVTNGGKVF
jgi:hypothetical protein